MFGAVTSNPCRTGQVVALPIGLSVPSTIADAVSPGVRVTVGNVV